MGLPQSPPSGTRPADREPVMERAVSAREATHRPAGLSKAGPPPATCARLPTRRSPGCNHPQCPRNRLEPHSHRTGRLARLGQDHADEPARPTRADEPGRADGRPLRRTRTRPEDHPSRQRLTRAGRRLVRAGQVDDTRRLQRAGYQHLPTYALRKHRQHPRQGLVPAKPGFEPAGSGTRPPCRRRRLAGSGLSRIPLASGSGPERLRTVSITRR